MALIEDNPPDHTPSRSRTFECRKPTYNNIRFTALELFKFTIGMGDLEFTDHVQYIEVFYILLISYIVLTYILLLNMLIALMSDTVERVSRESESIWRLQVGQVLQTALSGKKGLVGRKVTFVFSVKNIIYIYDGEGSLLEGYLQVDCRTRSNRLEGQTL